MSSDETSISKETKPSAQTLFGTSRHVADDIFSVSELITKYSRPSGADLALSQPVYTDRSRARAAVPGRCLTPDPDRPDQANRYAALMRVKVISSEVR